MSGTEENTVMGAMVRAAEGWDQMVDVLAPAMIRALDESIDNMVKTWADDSEVIVTVESVFWMFQGIAMVTVLEPEIPEPIAMAAKMMTGNANSGTDEATVFVSRLAKRLLEGTLP